MEIGQIASLRSQITSLEVQRATLSQSLTPDSPTMVRLEAQISELQSKVSGMLGEIKGTNSQSLPTQNLQLHRLERNVMYHQTVLTSLSAQLEKARISESYSVPRVRAVDRAALPVPQTWPKRTAVTAILSLVGFALGLLITAFSQIRRTVRRNPASARKLEEIRRLFHMRRT
jgi:uncharacterized protein involved in exopolysaccharide biosynthesis